jgi:hypothetical protein
MDHESLMQKEFSRGFFKILWEDFVPFRKKKRTRR